MNDKRHDYAYQVENAKRMAQEYQLPVRVYHVYMPSVYRVDRSPYAVDPIPTWHQEHPESWIRLMLGQGMTVVLPDSTVLEPDPPSPEKPKKRRKRPASTK